MSGAGTCAPTDSVVAFDNCMEIVADHSIQELTTDASRCAPATAPKTPAPCPADSDGSGGGNRGWCRTAWGGVHRVLSSSVGLVLLLIIYTVVGAAVLHHTESKREQQLHAQLDDIRRRVVADIINVTSRDRVTSRDPSDEAATAEAVEARLVEYSDARVSLRPNLKPTWTFAGALYFCGTVYTTIGYGNVVPITFVGRIITVIYALIGIPLCLVVLASVGKLLTRAIKYLWMFMRRFYYTGSCRRVRRMIPVSRLRMSLLQRIGYQLRRRTRRFRRAVRRRKWSPGTEAGAAGGANSDDESCVPYEVDDQFNLPPVVAILIGVTYTLLGALMYMSWESWTYFEAFYFTCISLSTIGFGDIVPDHQNFFIASSIYMLVGLALLAMIINVLMTAMHVSITTATTRVLVEVEQRLAERDQSASAGSVEPEIVAAVTHPQMLSAAPRRYSPTIHRRRSV